MFVDGQMMQRMLGQKPFFDSIEFTFGAAAAIGTTVTGSLRVSTDADFVVTTIRGSMRAVATGRVFTIDGNDGTEEVGGLADVPVDIQIQDAGDGRNMFREAVDARLAFPSGADSPKQLAAPWLLRAGSQVVVTCANLKIPAAAAVFTLMFEGIKVFRPGANG